MSGSGSREHPATQETASENGQIVLILVGLIGSGKSTFAKALERHFPNFRRCNQDDLGNRRKVENLCKASLQQGFSVCIDRTNFDETQREHFVNIAQAYPNVSVWALIFDTPYEICANRLQTRTNHPTITSPELGISILERFATDYRTPVAEEGFERILSITPHYSGDYTRDDIAVILDNIRSSPSLTPALPSPPPRMQFFRGGYGDRGRGRTCDRRSASPRPSSGWVNGSNMRKDLPSISSRVSWRTGAGTNY